MDKIQEVLETGVKEFGFPSISFAACKDGQVWTASAGYHDIEKKEPVNVEKHRYCVGSITKTFVAVVVMQLHEEGLLDLNQTALHYLQEHKHKGLVEDTYNTDRATILQLVNHQSGVPTWEFQEDAIRVMRGDKMDPKKIWKKHEPLLYSTKQLLEATCEPGAEYSYSNTNYTILGLVIEAVTKNKVAHEIRKRILEPLGMDNTYLEHHEICPEEGHTSHYHWATPEYLQAAGMNPEFKPVEGHPHLINVTVGNISMEWTAGGIVSTPTDLIKFAEGLGTPGCLMSPATHQQMFTYHPPKVIKPGDRVYMQGVVHQADFFGRDLYDHWGSTLGYMGFVGFIGIPGIGSFSFLTNVGLMHCFPTTVDVKYPRDFFPLLAKAVFELWGISLDETKDVYKY